jgi:hypothetical protein
MAGRAVRDPPTVHERPAEEQSTQSNFGSRSPEISSPVPPPCRRSNLPPLARFDTSPEPRRPGGIRIFAAHLLMDACCASISSPQPSVGSQISLVSVMRTSPELGSRECTDFARLPVSNPCKFQLRSCRAPGQGVSEYGGFPRLKWCCRSGLNARPLPYQGSALPLSYGSIRRYRFGPAVARGNTRGGGAWQGARRSRRAGTGAAPRRSR